MRHHDRRRTTRGPSASGRQLRHLTALFIALVTIMMAVPAAAPVAAQDQSGAEAQSGQPVEGEAQTGQDAPTAVEIHVSACEPGYAGTDHFNDCHGNGMVDVDVDLISANGEIDQTKATEQPQSPGVGVVQFGDIPAGTYTVGLDIPDQGEEFVTYCSLANSDEVIPMSPGNAKQGEIEVGTGQTVICDFYVIPTEASGGNAESGDQAQITINPVTCPEGTDPQSGFDTLAEACSEPVNNLTFTWGDASGPIETINTNTSEDRQVVIDGIEPGTYTLYSDVPLDMAGEVLSCVADEGNRYQKEFNEDGVTTFTDVKREQIACDWFIIPNNSQQVAATATSVATESPEQMATQDPVVTPTPESNTELRQSAATAPPSGGQQTEAEQADAQDARGVESGGSIVVHLALCPPEYDGDELFDACHGSGIADQGFTLTGLDGSVEQTTEVPQEPGPGFVEFTELPAGEYELVGGPPGDTGSVELYCTTQPGGAVVDVSLESTSAAFTLGQGEDVLCDWYYIPDNAAGETPTPTATPEQEERAEILVTLFACEPGADLTGAGYADLAAACDETRDDVAFTLGDVGAPPLTANTGVSGPGAVRFYDLLPADYTLTPELPDDLSNAAVFCQIDGGERYQKTITSGATTFNDVNGEAINCSWFAAQANPEPEPEPQGPSGSITVREFLCEEDQGNITDWERQCEAGSTGATFTLASTDGSISLDAATNERGVATYSDLPDGFYTLKQSEGMWCKARAERVDSQSRVIVEDGQNTDVFLYQCSQVTDLPSTGTGPGIGPMGEDAWWGTVSVTQGALMGVGVAGGMLLLGWSVRRRLNA